MMFKSEVITTWFVVMIIFLLLDQMKSIKISDFISLKSLSILELAITLFILLVLIEIMIYFLEVIVILSLGLLFYFSLLMMLISLTLSAESLKKCFFNLNNIFDVTLRSLSIRKLVEIRVQIYQLILFILLQLGQNIFAWPERNRQQNPGNASLFILIFFSKSCIVG